MTTRDDVIDHFVYSFCNGVKNANAMEQGNPDVKWSMNVATQYGWTLEDSGDWFGQLEYTPLKGQRPAGFNGAARVVYSNGRRRVWWQPPADIVRDPVAVEAVKDYVRGWYNDEWSFVSVIITRRTFCQCCGEYSNETGASLSLIESNSDADYIRSVLADLFSQCED